MTDSRPEEGLWSFEKVWGWTVRVRCWQRAYSSCRPDIDQPWVVPPSMTSNLRCLRIKTYFLDRIGTILGAHKAGHREICRTMEMYGDSLMVTWRYQKFVTLTHSVQHPSNNEQRSTQQVDMHLLTFLLLSFSSRLYETGVNIFFPQLPYFLAKSLTPPNAKQCNSSGRQPWLFIMLFRASWSSQPSKQSSS